MINNGAKIKLDNGFNFVIRLYRMVTALFWLQREHVLEFHCELPFFRIAPSEKKFEATFLTGTWKHNFKSHRTKRHLASTTK